MEEELLSYVYMFQIDDGYLHRESEAVLAETRKWQSCRPRKLSSYGVYVFPSTYSIY